MNHFLEADKAAGVHGPSVPSGKRRAPTVAFEMRPLTQSKDDKMRGPVSELESEIATLREE